MKNGGINSSKSLLQAISIANVTFKGLLLASDMLCGVELNC
jgi:hypothetical protein